MSLEVLFPYAEALRQALELEPDRFAGLVLAEELDLNCHAFRTLNKDYPPEKATEIYSAVVAGLTDAMPGSAAEALGITEVKDVATIGQLVHGAMAAFPTDYETVINSPNLHVGRIHWCPELNYTPATCSHNEARAYYRAQQKITADPLLTAFVEYGKRNGLEGEYETEVPLAQCVDATAPYCELVVKRKGIEYAPEPVRLDAYWPAGPDMEGKEPIAWCLEKQGRSCAEQAPMNLIAVVLIDMGFHVGVVASVGGEAGLGSYLKLAESRAEAWVADAKQTLEIGKVESAEQMAQIIAYCFGRRLIPMQIETNPNGEVVLSGGIDPYAQLPVAMGAKEPGDAYFAALSQGLDGLLEQIVVQAGAWGTFKVRMPSAIVRGEANNEIIVRTA